MGCGECSFGEIGAILMATGKMRHLANDKRTQILTERKWDVMKKNSWIGLVSIVAIGFSTPAFALLCPEGGPLPAPASQGDCSCAVPHKIARAEVSRRNFNKTATGISGHEKWELQRKICLGENLYLLVIRGDKSDDNNNGGGNLGIFF